MTASGRGGLAAALLAMVVGGLVWTILRDSRSEPYSIPRAALSGWTLEAGGAEDPWVVAARPPAAVAAALLKAVSGKTQQRLIAPPNARLGLVLRSEYDEGLQGVYGADAILRMARDAGLENATFEPICVGHKVDATSTVRRELFFVAFDAPEFRQLRADLIPPFPEHAGTGVYDPTTLSAVLPIGSTDGQLTGWFPFTFDKQVDCIAKVDAP